MVIDRKAYRDSVLGCWLGKSIGGTLGAPFEWRRAVHDVSFYTQDLGGEPLPNDDLDIQLLWLVALEERGVELDAHTLAEYWLLYVTPHWCEYGNAKINLRAGLMPPWSGIVANPYKHSCGAFIRSEIWACIAPGCPEVAARYAYEDAILDHGDGEGTFAEVFCAAFESAAFIEKDIPRLFEIALSYIPNDSGVARAVRNVIASHAEGKSWREARDLLLADYRGSTAMGYVWCTSEEDQAKGFHEGELGWDAPSNIGIIALGLLYGEGDFGKSLCTAVNCGEDTDCTGATLGSIFGLLHGASAIPQRWIDPIGRGIKTACLNLGELGYFGNQLPATVDALAERTERIADQALARRGNGVRLGEDAESVTGEAIAPLAPEKRDALYRNLTANVFRFDFFDVAIDYLDDPYVRDSEPKRIRVRITNTYKVQASINLHWHLPEGWSVGPGPDGTVYVKPLPWENTVEVTYTLQTERVTQPAVRAALELTMPGRAVTMLAPVVLLNGNVAVQA